MRSSAKLAASFSWQPVKYTQFETARLQPALDLLHAAKYLLPTRQDATFTCADFGAGTGNAIPHMLRTISYTGAASAQVLCVDSSPAMLEKAAAAMADLPAEVKCEVEALDFNDHDALDVWQRAHASSLDLLFTNAALHWVTPGAERQLEVGLGTAATVLRPGGVFALQVPDTKEQPSHMLISEALAEVAPDVHVTLAQNQPSPAQWLAAAELAGLSNARVWTTQYYQTLPITSATHPVVEFVSSTGLLPVVDALAKAGGDGLVTQFMDSYSAKISAAYPRQGDSHVVFPFQRMFLVAQQLSSTSE